MQTIKGNNDRLPADVVEIWQEGLSDGELNNAQKILQHCSGIEVPEAARSRARAIVHRTEGAGAALFAFRLVPAVAFGSVLAVVIGLSSMDQSPGSGPCRDGQSCTMASESEIEDELLDLQFASDALFDDDFLYMEQLI